MKSLLSVFVAMSCFAGSTALAGVLTCQNEAMTVVVNLESGEALFSQSSGKKLASDVVLNASSFAVRTAKVPTTALTLSFKKYGMLKVQLADKTGTGFGELNHYGEFSEDETGGEEVPYFKCASK